MKMSEIYERAAESIDSGRITYSCIAVADAADPKYFDGPGQHCDEYAATKQYINYFADDQYELQDMFEQGERRKEFRVLALCFAAAIAHSEGK